MQIPRHRIQRTMAQQVKRVLAVLVLVLMVYIMGSILLLGRERTLAIQELDQMSELYTSELDNRFQRVSRRLFSLMMEKNQPTSVFWNYVNMMDEEYDLDYPLVKLRENFLSSAWEYGQEYCFFLYLEDKERYFRLSIDSEGSYIGQEDVEQAVRWQIEHLKDAGMSYSVKKKWNIIASGGENYMCKIAQNQGVYLGCYVNVKSILEPFSSITMGKNGYVCLVNEQGESVGMLTSEGILNKESGMGEADRYSIEKQLAQAPFSIRMKISGERILEVMMGSVVVLILLAAILIASGAVILIYLKRNILQPVQRFTRKLEQYDSGEYALHLTEESLLELERIDDKFKNMIHQIRRLKITLYERELEKQKVEMDFLKLQIRPHFYLNCLNFIYSMIDFGQYDSARSMSKITADYLTYIFRNTSEKVPVTAETEHCQNYLDILLLRYPGSFEGYVEVHEEVRDAEIFPFLIQVFVENAAKHALTLEEKILISVTVYPEDREEGTYVNIYISDTGDGFAPDVLERLQRGEGISDGGHHVGIANCLQRFKLYYNGMGEMHFSNSPLGGAIVDIHLPYRRYAEDAKEESRA